MLFPHKHEQTDKETHADVASLKDLFSGTHRILVGAGAGLSASGGLNYYDAALVKAWFPSYFSKGFRSLPELQGAYWHIEDADPQFYWGVWGQHIWHVRYDSPVTKPYLTLRRLLTGKDAFIITTNADGQFHKAGFSEGMIFAPQGNYDQFQCSRPCSDDTYPDQALIEKMIAGLSYTDDGTPVVQRDDVPTCPRCGALLKPNLRCDSTFVEKPHMAQLGAYRDFLHAAAQDERPTLLLELGVGFNTPGIIRQPFDHFVQEYPQFHLVRVNKGAAQVPAEAGERAIGLDADINELLDRLL